MNNYDDLEDRIAQLEKEAGQYIGGLISSVRGRASLDLVILYIPGVALAMILSWSANSSILWAILHGYLSWAYVIYYAIFS